MGALECLNDHYERQMCSVPGMSHHVTDLDDGVSTGKQSFVVMLLDIRMPGKSGLEVMAEAAKPLPFPVIAMTGNVDVESVATYKYA